MLNTLIQNLEQTQTQELIQISETEINGVLTKTVNARDLHSFLEVGRDFSTWIKSRLSTLGSIEGEDYLLTKTGEQLPSGTKYKIDYFITIVLAKHISMMEKNERGYQIRNYFIECEKRLREANSIEFYIPKTLPDALEAYAKEIRAHNETRALLANTQEELNQALPKAAYCDIVLASPDLLTVTQIASDYGKSARWLNKFLEDKGVQYRQGKQWVLKLKYMTNNYAQVFTHAWRDAEDKQHSSMLLKWTQKGRLFIYDLLKSEGYLPLCEQS